MIIREAQPASCPPSAVIEFAIGYFEARDLEGAAFEPSCHVIIDERDRGRSHHALELGWSHNSGFLLPHFSGSLTVRCAYANSTITLAGNYDLPLTTPPSLVDAATLAIAGAAMRAMLQEIVSHVETEWVRFAAGCPTIVDCNAARPFAVL